MLPILAATAVLVAPWYLIVSSAVAFVIGTRIRIRLEERLLKNRFGDELRRYQDKVAAFVPFVI
jgi:protein-S-isoprenylcysteine O-methyltransferase Ste14